MSSQRIGRDPHNFWTYDSDTGLIDLSRGNTSGKSLTLQTTTNPIRLNPATTALVIVDMQNLFLSRDLRAKGNTTPSAGEVAAQTLLDTGIPAARRHNIRVVWLNWGLTEEDLNTMPPAVMRAFGVYDPVPSPAGETTALPSNVPAKRVKSRTVYKGPGEEIGPVDLGENGGIVDAGRLLMRDSWNTALHPPLEEEYHRGASLPKNPDVWINKNRMSGLWGASTHLEEYLTREGITTILFAGVNTDICVGGTLLDAFSKGYDCILLRDGAATTSPAFATEDWEYNVQRCWGFVTTCAAVQEAKLADNLTVG